MRWRDAPGYEGRYQVSDTGQVRNTRRGTAVADAAHTHGYRQVNLYADNVGRKFYVHRLVAIAFVPGFFDGAEVNHLNGNKADNRAANLEWVDRSANVAHSYATLPRRPHCKTTPVTVGGASFPSLLAAAKAHGVRVGAVWKALVKGRLFQGKEIRRV